MIQNFKNHASYLSNGELPEGHFTFGNNKIFFKLDSENKIFTFKYHCQDESLNSYFEFLGNYLQDKTIDELTLSYAHEIYGIIDKENIDVIPFKLDLALSVTRQALKNLKQEGIATGIQSDEIVCRCNHIDLPNLKELFHRFKGSKKEIVKNSNIGMSCGTCREDFDCILKNLNGPQLYRDGKTTQELKVLIHESLTSFSDYSAQDLSEVEIEKIDIGPEKVILSIRVLKPGFDTNQLKVSLTNFLCSKLNMALEVDLTVL